MNRGKLKRSRTLAPEIFPFLDLHRHCKEREFLIGQLIEIAHALDDRNACTEENGVGGPRQVSSVINVVGVDDKRRAVIIGLLPRSRLEQT
jgi:hypothetical protein